MSTFLGATGALSSASVGLRPTISAIERSPKASHAAHVPDCQVSPSGESRIGGQRDGCRNRLSGLSVAVEQTPEPSSGCFDVLLRGGAQLFVGLLDHGALSSLR